MNPAVFANPPAACTAGTAGAYGPDRIAKYGYDAADEVTSVTSGLGTADALTETAAYTLNGRQQTVADGNGNLSTFEYDGFERLARIRYPNPTGGGSSTTDDELYAYDAASNPTRITRRNGQVIALSYDRLNRLTLRNPPGTDKDVTYAHDLLGRMTSAAFPSQSLGFGYDALNRNTSASGPLGTVSYLYDAASRRTRTTWPDGFYVTYDHDLADEMTAIRENGAASGIGVLASFSYDDLGRRTRLDRGNGVSTTYAWDPAPRLTEIFHNMTSGGNRRIKLEDYNPAGQIVGRSATNDAFAYTGHANVNRAYTVDGLNRVTSTGGTTLSYNPLSDLTNDGTRTYNYDFDDRLTGSGAVALEYDPAGRLYREQGAADTRFLYDGVDAIGEYNNTGSLQRRYVHGPGVDEPLVWYEGLGTAERRWLLADERGSVIAWTTPAGTTGAIDSYDDYGIPAAANVGRFQYTGQMWLPEIGVYHYKARAYHPQLGRFLQPDPIGYGSGLNLYAYVRNDPVNLIDPLGLTLICPTPTTCYTVRDGSGSDEFEELVVTGHRIEQVEFVPTDWNVFDFSTRGIQQINLGTGERGGASGSDEDPRQPTYCSSAGYQVGKFIDQSIGGGIQNVGVLTVVGGGAIAVSAAITGVGIGAGGAVAGIGGVIYAGGTAISTVGQGIKFLSGQSGAVTMGGMMSLPLMRLGPLNRIVADKGISAVYGRVVPDPC